jgi:hypothetical protein
MSYEQSFKKNMMCPSLLRMSVFLPLPADELSSTSPMCGKTQGNDMVSGDGNCMLIVSLILITIHLYLMAMFYLWT